MKENPAQVYNTPEIKANLQEAVMQAHLGRLGVIGLHDETYSGTAEGLMEFLGDTSDNS